MADERDEYEDEYDDYEDEPERGVDEMPHRGGLVLGFGITSIVMAVASILFCLTGVFGLPLGIFAWMWGRKDLRAMDAGYMDPSGRGTTQGGYVCGIIGTVLSSIALFGFLVYLVFVVAVMAGAMQ